MNIRNFKQSDYPMIYNWWSVQKEQAPLLGMLPEESTFVLELNKQPALCVTIYLTNTKELAYVENLVGNPELKSKERKEATYHLNEHLKEFAKSKGYKRLVCMSEKAQLKNYYTSLNYTETLNNVSTFVREL